MVADIDFGRGISDAWSSVAEFVPKLGAFLVILVIGMMVVRAAAKLVTALLRRLGFDRAVERGGLHRHLERSGTDASELLGRIVRAALGLLVLQMAFGVFGRNPVSGLLQSVVAYLPKVAVAIVIVVIASAIAAAVRDLVATALGAATAGDTIARAAGIAVIALGVFAALDQLEIAPAIVTGLFYAVLAVVAGSAIIAIGGGGIAPMRARWEHTLARYDEEKAKVRDEPAIRLEDGRPTGSNGSLLGAEPPRR